MMKLQDLIKAIKAIYAHFQQCQSIEELEYCIEQLFGSENNKAVLLSTVHRAKGMEAKRVYIAEPYLLPLDLYLSLINREKGRRIAVQFRGSIEVNNSIS